MSFVNEQEDFDQEMGRVVIQQVLWTRLLLEITIVFEVNWDTQVMFPWVVVRVLVEAVLDLDRCLTLVSNYMYNIHNY